MNNNLNDAKEFLGSLGGEGNVKDDIKDGYMNLSRLLVNFADQQRNKWNTELIEQLDLVRPNVTVSSLKEAVKEWVR